MFEFSEEPDGHLIRIALTGFWSMETFNAYRVRFQDELRKIHSREGRCSVLIDSRTFPIQSAEVAAGFRELVDGQLHRKNVCVAILLPGALAKLQAERAVGAHNARFFFGEPEEALAWLESANAA